jgi:5-methyltetrahydrofolate--homocysteine methyltransferase
LKDIFVKNNRATGPAAEEGAPERLFCLGRAAATCGDAVAIFDSAMGTSLIGAGVLAAGGDSGRANIDAPHVVLDIHRRNIAAGCDVVTANTFGVRIPDAAAAGEDPAAAEEALRAGVRLAKKAASEAAAEGRRVFTALDIGPVGGVIGLTNDMTHDDAIAIFARAAGTGAGEGADLILIETMSDLAEAVDAITAAKEETDLPVICTMAFDENGRTFMGVSPEEFVKAAAEAGADAVGANCSLGPAGMLPIAESLVAAAGGIPVLVQPNAGKPVVDGAEVRYDMTPEEFADGALAMARAGARLVGGCCGSTPEMISMLKKRLCQGRGEERFKNTSSDIITPKNNRNGG